MRTSSKVKSSHFGGVPALPVRQILSEAQSQGPQWPARLCFARPVLAKVHKVADGLKVVDLANMLPT